MQSCLGECNFGAKTDLQAKANALKIFLFQRKTPGRLQGTCIFSTSNIQNRVTLTKLIGFGKCNICLSKWSDETTIGDMHGTFSLVIVQSTSFP